MVWCRVVLRCVAKSVRVVTLGDDRAVAAGSLLPAAPPGGGSDQTGMGTNTGLTFGARLSRAFVYYHN